MGRLKPLMPWLWTCALVGGVLCVAAVAMVRTGHDPALLAAGVLCLGGVAVFRQYRPRISFGEAILVAVAILLPALIAEGAARLMLPPFMTGDRFVMPHPTRMTTPAVGTTGTAYLQTGPQSSVAYSFAINGQGFRGPAAGPKAAGEIRVLALGDSFTAGKGLNDDQTLPVQLERYLRASSTGRTVTVINGGCDGYGPWQELDFYHEIGLPLEPDLVLLQVLMDNDIADTLVREGKTLASYAAMNLYVKGVMGHYFTDSRARIEERLFRYSALYKLLMLRSGGRLRVTRLVDQGRFYDGPLMAPLPLNGDRPNHLEAALRNWYPDLTAGWAAMVADMGALKAACDAKGIPLVVYAVPSEPFVVDSTWRASTEPYGGDETYDRSKPEHLVAGAMAENAIAYIDLFPAFRGLSNGSDLYYPLDGHFTAAGADAAARLIAAYLTEHFGALLGSATHE